jgi:hypothetical protein
MLRFLSFPLLPRHRPKCPQASGVSAGSRLASSCFISCGGALLNSLYLLINGPEALPDISSARWTVGFIQEVSALLLLGYVLSRRGLNVTNLGLRWSLGDIGVGLLVAGASFAAYVMGSALVHAVHYWIYGSLATGPTGKTFFASVRGRDPIYPFESVL